MKLRSPIAAMLWENWRLSRVEAAQRFGFGIVLASAALALSDSGATIAFWILILNYAFIWFSIAKLNGGRFMDGYKPGFPFYLHYTLPVPTVVIVGVAVAYDALSSIALYLVSAALLGFAFGQPLPLFSVILCLAASHFLYALVQYSTSNRVVQWVGSAVFIPLYFLLKENVKSPLQVEFSLGDNALLLLICIVSFGLTVAGVARQRRGDAVAITPRAAQTGGFSDWLITPLRFQCPTSSATRAQVWFELKSSGIPILLIGLGIAITISLAFAIGVFVTPARNFAVAFPMVFSVPLLLFLGGNAFGIRRKQGRMYTSAFEATMPYGTAQLAGVKVLVRTASVLAAAIVVAVCAWASSSLMSDWGAWIVEGKDSLPRLLEARRKLIDVFWTGYAPIALTVGAALVAVTAVASFATLTALRARYSRRVNIAMLVLGLYVLAVVLLQLGQQNGVVSQFVLDAVVLTTLKVAAAVLAPTIVYLAWRGVAERTLTPTYLLGAFAISAALGAALLPVTTVARVLPTCLILLALSVLTTWSFSRVRHT
jgi:hypothetical protein